MNPAIRKLPRKQRLAILAAEAKRRRLGEWGEWETDNSLSNTGARGWLGEVNLAHKNRVFSVLERHHHSGAVHLAVSSLSGRRPSWHEMQRIKDDIAGTATTAVEVYPPHHEIVDEADMFHIWVMPTALPFSLHHP